MFIRFDPAARRVLRSAEQASRNHNHYFIGVGHLLLGLLEERDAAILSRLSGLGVASSELAEATRRALGTGDDRVWDGILVTPRVRSVVARAERAAGEGSIAPCALFDALLAESGGLVCDVVGSLRRDLRDASDLPEGQTVWNA